MYSFLNNCYTFFKTKEIDINMFNLHLKNIDLNNKKELVKEFINHF